MTDSGEERPAPVAGTLPARVTTVIESLGSGGAERNLLRLSEALARRGYRVTVLTTDPVTEDFYEVPLVVRRVRARADCHLSCRWFDLMSQYRRLSALRSAVLATRPDLVISFIDTLNVSVLLALWGCSVPVIVSERIDPRFHDIGTRWRLLRRLTYPRARRVVLLAGAAMPWAQSRWPRWRVVSIPNPVMPCDRPASPLVAPVQPSVVAVGRLQPQKGFDLLIRAFASIASELPQWTLEIVGEGPERRALLQLAEQLGVAERVHLPGVRKNPFPLPSGDTVFVLSSRYEGFGMALGEAMAAGLPVISFDCPSGPRQIVRHEVDGLLVPPENVAALATAMRRLMERPDDRAKLAARAPEVVERFSKESVFKRWDTLICEVLGETAA